MTQESAEKLILTLLNEVRGGNPGGSGGLRGSFYPNAEMMRSFAASGQFVKRHTSHLEKEVCCEI